MSREQIDAFIEEDDPHSDIQLADGFDTAFIGIIRLFHSTVALYDYSKCVLVLMERDGVSEEEAVEYLEYNVLGAYMGDKTPAFLVKKFIE